MPANNEQIYMEQSQTVENDHTFGDKVYYTGTGKTFENGDWIQYGSQGKVEGPVNGEELQGEGDAGATSLLTSFTPCVLSLVYRRHKYHSSLRTHQHRSAFS